MELLQREQKQMLEHQRIVEEANQFITRVEEELKSLETRGDNSKKSQGSSGNRAMRKGVESDLKNGIVKVTVERESKEDISVCGLVEYTLKIEQNRYLPAKEYP